MKFVSFSMVGVLSGSVSGHEFVRLFRDLKQVGALLRLCLILWLYSPGNLGLHVSHITRTGPPSVLGTKGSLAPLCGVVGFTLDFLGERSELPCVPLLCPGYPTLSVCCVCI